ncbi:MAG: MMPL family transporter, partial [Planctomycetaceae bacterium]
MFRVLGHFASRYWPAILIGWAGLLATIVSTTPRFGDVVQDGEFRFIPDTGRLWPWETAQKFTSREGENLFKNSFSRDLLGSSVVLVLRRESHPDGLLEKDRRFIRNVLLPRLEAIQKSEAVPAGSGQTGPVIIRIRTLDDDGIGELLVSEDGKATLVILELRTEFLETRNRAVLKKVEGLISRNGELRNPTGNRESHLTVAGVGTAAGLPLQTNDGIPVGLDISLSGTATVGRDMRLAQEQSAANTHVATLTLVFVLLLLIYRSPLLVLVPMLTVFASVTIALQSLAFLSSLGEVELFWGWTFQLQLFAGVEIYVQVVMYGAGIDYCMFLTARYKEELDRGASFADAVADAVGKVGSALAASAGTTMAGIGMMYFAQFGKFKQAGIAMSFSLLFVLAASLTLTPAMFRLFGRWAFWPQTRSEGLPEAAGWVSPTRLVDRLMQTGIFHGVWEKIGRRLRERPGTVWLASIAVMAPFVVVAVLNHGYLSFGLLSELPAESPSVVGTRAVQQHFPAGATGPVTILLRTDELTFEEGGAATDSGRRFIRTVTERLQERRKDLGIADIRSLTSPFGISEAAQRAERNWAAKIARLGSAKFAAIRKRNDEELAHYVGDKGRLAGHVTRIDVVFDHDPFSRNMIAQLDETRRTVLELLPEEHRDDAELYVIGSTASISDLKTVTG